jgi:hypothetical protein
MQGLVRAGLQPHHMLVQKEAIHLVRIADSKVVHQGRSVGTTVKLW